MKAAIFLIILLSGCSLFNVGKKIERCTVYTPLDLKHYSEHDVLNISTDLIIEIEKKYGMEVDFKTMRDKKRDKFSVAVNCQFFKYFAEKQLEEK